MKQGNIAQCSNRSPSNPAQSSELSTAAQMSTLPPAADGGYQKLRQWPDLAPAVSVFLNMGTVGAFRVPVKMMRRCGMRPELGVHVAVLVDRIIIWGDERGGPHLQDAESKMFFLKRAGVGPRLTQANFAIVEGPDYLVITTRNNAFKMAGAAEVIENNRWDRLGRNSVPRQSTSVAPEDITVLDWQDVNLFHSNVRTKSGIAKVAGRLWWLAGMRGGDPIRFARYENATTVEKCSPADQHSVLCQSKTGNPTHYIGTALFDVHLTSRVRIIATPGKLIVTLPESDLGRLCIDPNMKAPVSKQQCAPTFKFRSPENRIELQPANVLALKDCKKDGPTVCVYGRIWNAAGFAKLAPARMVQYADAVAIERCAEEQAEFRVGSASQDAPYRHISLANTALADATRIRILVAKGSLILTTRNSDVGRQFRNTEPWPNSPVEVSELMDRLCKQAAADTAAAPVETTATPVETAAAPVDTAATHVDVVGYTIPDGRRLQVQGKWLGKFGFVPGARFEVAANNGEVHIRLVEAGGSAVTEHSPGTSKLYVPAQSIKALGAGSVRVLAVKGELRLVPLAA